MKHQWFAYLIVAFLSIGAGVAIAGMPNNVPVDATITPPTTTEAPAPSVPSTTDPAVTSPEPDTTDRNSTDPDTTDPDTTDPDTTDTDPTDPDTTDSVPAALPERSEIIVAAANGAGIAGTAARGVATLTALGYTDVIPFDATEIVDVTTIYYADGLEDAAARMALDLELPSDSIAPLGDAPPVVNLAPDTQLLAYLGIDRAR